MSDSEKSGSLRQERLNQIIAEYLEAVEAGKAPDREALLERHPGLAGELRAFFADHDKMKALAELEEPGAAEAEQPTLPPRGPADGSAGEGPTLPPVQRATGDAATLPPRVAKATSDAAVPPVGTTIRYFGDYELLEEIARGGMGVVYKARQLSLNRVVALKMILAGQLAGEQDVKRFYTEAEAAANLDHPGIVPIFEVGEHEGQHYFSMGFVEGESLADKLKDGPLPPREAAEYTKKVSEAIAFAHERGVIHRDLKPANVLLDRDDQPKVTDFGLAKRTESDSNLTGTGQILGTPSYMPPEQASGKVDEVTDLADVYALGAILYALVTGRPPFQADNPLDTLMQVLEREPVAPRTLNSKVPQDLETICLKCLEKDRQRRYASADELEEELRRFLDGKPIIARPISRTARTWRWCKRNPLAASLTAVAVVSLLAGTVISSCFAVSEAQQRDLADQKKREAEVQRSRADDEADIAKANAELARRQERTARRYWYASDMSRAQAAWDQHDVGLVTTLLAQHVPAPGADDLRDFAWHYLSCLCASERVTLRGHVGTVNSLAYSPDGSMLACAVGTYMSPGEVVVWNTDDWQRRFSGGGFRHEVQRIQFSPDGRFVAGSNVDQLLKVFDSANGEQVVEIPDGRSAIFSPDSRRLLVTTVPVTLWDLESRAVHKRIPSEDFYHGGVFSPDGLLWAGGGNDYVNVWNVTTLEVQATFSCDGSARSVAFSPNGKLLAGVDGSSVYLWDVDARQQVLTVPSAAWNVAFSPDGKLLAGIDRSSVYLWDVDARQQALAVPVANGGRYQFSSDSTLMAVTGSDSRVHFWDVKEKGERNTLGPHGDPGTKLGLGFAISPDNKLLATTVAGDRTAKLWHIESGREIETLVGHQSMITALAFDPGGKTVAVAAGAEVKVWDVPTSRESPPMEAGGGVAFFDGGKRLVTGAEQSIKIWDAATGELLEEFEAHQKPVRIARVSPDGSLLATMPIRDRSSEDGAELKLWDLATRKERTISLEPEIGISDLAFSPKGKYLAYSGGSGRFGRPGYFALLDLELGRKHVEVGNHVSTVDGIAFSPDGKHFVTAGGDASAPVKLWEVATGKQVHVIVAQSEEAMTRKMRNKEPIEVVSFHGAAFSPDGSTLAIGASRNRPSTQFAFTSEIWLFDTSSWERRVSFQAHDGIPMTLLFSPDGQALLSMGAGQIKFWDPVVGQQRFTLSGPRGGRQALAFSPDSLTLAVMGSWSEQRRNVVELWRAVEAE